MTLVLALNALFALLNLSWARDAFDADRTFWGWAYLTLSAWCAACVLVEII